MQEAAQGTVAPRRLNPEGHSCVPATGQRGAKLGAGQATGETGDSP